MTMKFVVGNKVVYLNLDFKVFDVGDWQIALDSGKAFKGSHYLLLDYDHDFPSEFARLVVDNKMKRGLILESTPGKYHAVSFTPLPFEDMIEIMRGSRCDPKQLSVTIKRGFSGIRVTAKKGFKIRVLKEINNRNKQTHFYNYHAEKAYLREIARGKDGSDA